MIYFILGIVWIMSGIYVCYDLLQDEEAISVEDIAIIIVATLCGFVFFLAHMWIKYRYYIVWSRRRGE